MKTIIVICTVALVATINIEYAQEMKLIFVGLGLFAFAWDILDYIIRANQKIHKDS